jgi:hypothetical protein
MMLGYYAQPGRMSEVGEYAPVLRALPQAIPTLVQNLQGLVVHVFWAERYGVKLSEERKAEVQICLVRPKLARLLEIDSNDFLHVPEDWGKI